MARRERGILLSDSRILALSGNEVRTFYGCDENYLEMCGVGPGDFISFNRGYGTDDAVDFKSATPNPAEAKKLAKPEFAGALAAAKATHAALLAHRASSAASKAAADASPAATSDRALVAPIVTTLASLGLVTHDVDLDKLTKKLVEQEPLGHGTTARILFALEVPRIVSIPGRIDAFFAGVLDNALEGAPVRVQNLAASFKTGFQIVFKTNNVVLETSWFTSAHDVVEKLDEYLAQRSSRYRVYWLPHTRSQRALFIATSAEATALGATS